MGYIHFSPADTELSSVIIGEINPGGFMYGKKHCGMKMSYGRGDRMNHVGNDNDRCNYVAMCGSPKTMANANKPPKGKKGKKY